MFTTPDKAILSQWSESAPYWEKHRDAIREMFAPITRGLLEDGKVRSGNTVLDVATGPGEPALSLADAVGSEGTVVGIDPVREMVEAGRREALCRQLNNVGFEVAFADSLPFPDHTFDAVVSRFGVMFFPSPFDGIREMLRVLKPAGRIALAVWHFAERNPFHHVLSQVLTRYVHSPPPPADSPDAFRFAQPGKLLDILAGAGALDASERLLQFVIKAPVSVEEFWTLRSEMSEKLRTKLSVLSEEQIAEMRSEVIENLRPYYGSGRMSLPAEVLIVSGAKAVP